MQLLCSRPHAKEVDFLNSKFVVGKICGVNVAGHRYEMGDVLPTGCLSAIALREIYEPPLSLIDTFEWAIQDPALLEACLRRDAANALSSDQEGPHGEMVETDTEFREVIDPVEVLAPVPEPRKKHKKR